ncbi:lanthionine synthetase C family protein [Kitasatospora sp. GAS1066B]|uniref:lanthionine synthetase C family protein n=1 Tax=Kitasatospora sp. GAS1066B TaxID=3156271 RepID=UPI003519543F
MTHLALHRHDRDERHLDRAAQLRATIPDDPELTPLLGPDDATGLLHGRPGVALLDYYLHHLTGDPTAIRRGLALLRTEAGRAVEYPGGGLAFRISTTDNRLFPYLHRGSAGLALVADRYLPHLDESAGAEWTSTELATLIERCLTPGSVPTTAYSGLYEGRAGLVLALADHATWTGSPADRETALAAARRLYCHAVTHPTGVRFSGEHTFRLSADLWSGSAGVLLGLTRLLDGPVDAFFTLDDLVRSAAPR